MREAVAGILAFGQEIYVVQRQPYLAAFPGYQAFPGGKVDESDLTAPDHSLINNHSSPLMAALHREFKEELAIDFFDLLLDQKIEHIYNLGVAYTPDFNPHRFATYFFLIQLKERPAIDLDSNELAKGEWLTPKTWMLRYQQGLVIAVPPMIKIINHLVSSRQQLSIDFQFSYNKDRDVPMIETQYGIKQFMPLSNTLPPANRTNCFLIGDLLIDPSPKDFSEYQKLLNSLQGYSFEKIFLTHHHPDHYQYSADLARYFSVPIFLSQLTKKLIMDKEGQDYFNGIELVHMKEGDIATRWLNQDVYVYEVPGHDNGQLGLMDQGRHWFICSDLFQGIGSVVVGGSHSSMKLYFESLKKVIALNPLYIYPSHGIPLGSTFILEKTLQHRESREQQILELAKEKMSIEDMHRQIYPDLTEKLAKYAIANIVSHLKKLVEESLLPPDDYDLGQYWK